MNVDEIVTWIAAPLETVGVSVKPGDILSIATITKQQIPVLLRQNNGRCFFADWNEFEVFL